VSCSHPMLIFMHCNAGLTDPIANIKSTFPIGPMRVANLFHSHSTRHLHVSAETAGTGSGQ
jgi:hypothetical protein